MPVEPQQLQNIAIDWSGANAYTNSNGNIEYEPIAAPSQKKAKIIIDKDWREHLIRDLYPLHPMPKLDLEYVEAFMKHNSTIMNFPKIQFTDVKTHVGIEVEVENVAHINPNILLCFWKIAEDGSLRNHGKEFKTMAISLKYAQTALELLFSGLNPDIDFSSRTSIHVHLDVRGLTINQLLTLLFTYSVVENVLFKFAGIHRRNNIFCVPITETSLFRVLNVENTQHLGNTFEGIWQKYTALNLLPITTFGTVEFRQLPGTNDVTKICIWLELLSRIKLYAYKNTLANVLNSINELNTNSQYRKFVESIFGDYTSYLDTTNLLNDMEKAVYICKNCSAINKFHETIISSPLIETSSLSQKLKSIQTQIPIEIKTLNSKMYKTFRYLFLHYGSAHFHTEVDFYRDIYHKLGKYVESFPDQSFQVLFIAIAENPI